MNYWNELKDFFDEDDGSLPDIFIENLTGPEKEDIFGWILGIVKFSANSSVYSLKENKAVPAISYSNPVRDFNKGEIEPFRFALKEVRIKDIFIPLSSIGVGFNEIEFDYQMGKEWGPLQVEALLEFLAQIKDKVPAARIIQAYEGMYNEPNLVFTKVFDEYYIARSSENL
jgi:hypothetical protein